MYRCRVYDQHEDDFIKNNLTIVVNTCIGDEIYFKVEKYKNMVLLKIEIEERLLELMDYFRRPNLQKLLN